VANSFILEEEEVVLIIETIVKRIINLAKVMDLASLEAILMKIRN